MNTISSLEKTLVDVLNVATFTEDSIKENDNAVSGYAVKNYVDQYIQKTISNENAISILQQTPGGTDSADYSALTTTVNSNTGRIDTLETTVGGISTNATDIATNTSNITSLTTDVTTNTSNITSLTTNVTSNTGRIDTLETTVGGISTNATNIATNTSNITSLTTNVTSNTGRIDTLETTVGGISTNATNIATNTSNITSLTTDVTTNTSNITSLTTNVTSNTGRIDTLETTVGGISTNATNIATNTSNITSLTTDVTSNTSDIATNTSNITSLTTTVNSNTGRIDTLEEKENISLSMDSNFSIPSHSNITNVPLSQEFKTGNISWDNVNQRLTISKTGYYILGGVANLITSSGTSLRYVSLRAFKNGSEFKVSRTQINDFSSGSNNYESIPFHYMVSLSANDYLEFKMSSNSTGASIDSNSDSSIFLYLL